MPHFRPIFTSRNFNILRKLHIVLKYQYELNLFPTGWRNIFNSNSGARSAREARSQWSLILIKKSGSNSPINSKLQHSPPGNPRAFDCPSCPGVGNLNLAWVRWGIWTRTLKSFRWNILVLYFTMEVLKGIDFTFASRCLKRRSTRKSRLLILPFMKTFSMRCGTCVGHLLL